MREQLGTGEVREVGNGKVGKEGERRWVGGAVGGIGGVCGIGQVNQMGYVGYVRMDRWGRGGGSHVCGSWGILDIVGWTLSHCTRVHCTGYVG